MILLHSWPYWIALAIFVACIPYDFSKRVKGELRNEIKLK